MMTASALRRDQHDGVYKFPEEVSLLQQYFGPAHQQAYVRAYPAVGKNVPLYILVLFNRFCIIATGLPYVFAGHFAPQQMKEAIEIYKTLFEPSDVLDEPYVMCLNTIVAENDDEAQYLASSMAQVMVSITRGRMQPVQPPTHELQKYINAERICDGYGKTENIINRFRKYYSTKKFKILWKLMVKSTKLWQ